ncbi:hypothetical protein [Streptococcus pneumoniae]|uniref:hypothetical protein n=1 Tax=Streptococcus pneumoniae TaxID=1313 RepID=UPI00125CF9AC|nr:hypothetical protein [Streptococcus pneumoniae]
MKAFSLQAPCIAAARDNDASTSVVIGHWGLIGVGGGSVLRIHGSRPRSKVPGCCSAYRLRDA